MKCLFAIVLLALFAMAFGEERPLEPEKVGPVPVAPPHEAPRDKRGVLLSYPSSIAYSPYSAPITYSSYGLPYTYRSYPYYYSSWV